MAENREKERANREGKKLQYLNDLSDYKVADEDPDVRGWALLDAENQTIGTVDNLLVDMENEKVRYLDVDIDESLLSPDHEPYSESDLNKPHEFKTREGNTHMIVPVGLTRIDRDHKAVICREVNKDRFEQTNRFKKGEPITPDYEHHVVSTLIGPSAIPGSSRSSAGNDMLRTDENFYNSNYFNEDSFYGRERNTAR